MGQRPARMESLGVDTQRAKVPADVVAEDLERCYQWLGDTVQQLAGTTIVVTGASGFLGSYLVDLFAGLNRGILPAACHILAIDNYSSGRRGNLAHLYGRSDVSVLEADVSGPMPLPHEVHYIVHAASIASPIVYRRFPLETIKANVQGTWNLLEAARSPTIRSFLLLSTSEVYGDPSPEHVPTREDYWGNVNPVGPRACYDESKRLGETLCMAYYRLYGTPVKICRLFNIYGPRMALDDGRLIADLMKAAVHGLPLTLYSDGRATRSFCYVSDVLCQLVHLLLLGPEGQVFNVGSDQEVTVKEVAELASHLLSGGAAVEFARHQDRDYITDNPLRRRPDLSRVRSLASFPPPLDLMSGLTRTARWHGLDIAA